jgi:large subunit ribosomal protein L23
MSSKTYSILKSPLLTEKNTDMAVLRKYVFIVANTSNKIEIKQAVEKAYNVKVSAVACAVIRGKSKRLRTNAAGRTSDWKKAFVTLKPGFEIKFA